MTPVEAAIIAAMEELARSSPQRSLDFREPIARLCRVCGHQHAMTNCPLCAGSPP